jgi:hypothetical protein
MRYLSGPDRRDGGAGTRLIGDEKGVHNRSCAPLEKVVHDAFKTMERELRRLVDKQRHEVKTHAEERSPK